MFQWKPDMVRFMVDASEYGDYNGELARRIALHLPENASVCDAGCGLGYLSLALSPLCAQVTAVDIAPRALDVLRGNLLRFGRSNISVVEGDIWKHPPKTPYDAMVFSFFGRTLEALELAKAQCRGKLIMIKKNWNGHRFTLNGDQSERFTAQSSCGELDALGVPYSCEAFELELGQPFRSMDDAVAFFHTYSRDADPKAITAADIAGRLVRRDDAAFPYYLPYLKRMGMIVLEAADIPDEINKTIEGE